jgi:hypothetical protein
LNFHWGHMRKEEERILPLAEQVLTETDWAEIDAAFAGNADPLIRQDVKRGFDELLTRIVSAYVEYVHDAERLYRYEAPGERAPADRTEEARRR